MRANALALVLALPAAAFGQGARFVIHADQGRDTISRHIYGQFAEHLGRGIYDGFWTKSGTGRWHLRDDVIAALRKIQVPNVRWPGGCYADRYHWQDGIGPPEQRPTIVNTMWGNVTEDNSFGTHEYLELVDRLGAAPFIVANDERRGTEAIDQLEILVRPEAVVFGHVAPHGVDDRGTLLGRADPVLPVVAIGVAAARPADVRDLDLAQRRDHVVTQVPAAGTALGPEAVVDAAPQMLGELAVDVAADGVAPLVGVDDESGTLPERRGGQGEDQSQRGRANAS